MSPAFPQSVQGHHAILCTLSRALEENRLPSALLFHGPAGVGKLTTAVALCRTLLCSAPGSSYCGSCDICRRVSGTALLHPDIGVLAPQSRRQASSEPSLDEAPRPPNLHELQEVVRSNPAWRILVDPARIRLQELFLSPAQGKRRILLVLSAERLGDESGNALLKTLEEPPPHALLILLCESISALLPTIRSRCQICRFGPLSRSTLATLLKRELELSDDRARLLSALAGGRPGLAKTLARNLDLYRHRRSFLHQILSDIRHQKGAGASLLGAQTLLSDPVEGLDDLAVLMDLLRDAMLVGCGCDSSNLTDPGQFEKLSQLGLGTQEAASLLWRVEATLEDIRRNVNRQLAVESLFLDLSGQDPAL